MLEGDRNDDVLLITEGRLKVVKSSDDGREQVLAVRGPGALVGELTAVANDGLPRSATVVAIEPVRARVLTGDAFRSFLVAHPGSSIALLRLLVGRLRASDRKRAEFGSLDVSHRVARLLLDLATDGGAAGDDGPVTIGISLSQEELAGMVATSRETMVRALAALRRRGLIETGRRSITILDVTRLRDYAIE
jgi:CRP-like cAMP-binding protein